MYDCAGMDTGFPPRPRTKELCSSGKSQARLRGEQQRFGVRLSCCEITDDHGGGARFEGYGEMLFVVHENQIAGCCRVDARYACQLNGSVSKHTSLHKIGDLFDGSGADQSHGTFLYVCRGKGKLD